MDVQKTKRMLRILGNFKDTGLSKSAITRRAREKSIISQDKEMEPLLKEMVEQKLVTITQGMYFITETGEAF